MTVTALLKIISSILCAEFIDILFSFQIVSVHNFYHLEPSITEHIAATLLDQKPTKYTLLSIHEKPHTVKSALSTISRTKGLPAITVFWIS